MGLDARNDAGEMIFPAAAEAATTAVRVSIETRHWLQLVEVYEASCTGKTHIPGEERKAKA
jgi:hypothetical protein